jgi:hypothetical protein
MSGKGSKPRPIANRKQFDDNWDAIFCGKKSKPDGSHEEESGWIPTNREEPEGWEDHAYIWTYWPQSWGILLDESFGFFEWESITHWMPADVKVPKMPGEPSA